MALIERIWPWDGQPQEAVGVDWGNPLAQRLVYAVLPSSRGAIESARGKPITLGGTLTASDQGIVRSQTGSQSAFVFADGGENRPTEFTQFARLRRTGTVDNNNDAIGKSWQTGSAPTFVSFSIPYNASGGGQNIIGCVQGVSGGLVSAGTYAHPDTTRWHDIAQTKPSGSILLYVDGVQRLSASAGPIAYGASGNNDFKTNANSLTSPFDFAVILFWDRALSAQEVAEVSRNPWQLFEPRRIWVPVAGGGAANLTVQDASHAHSADSLTLTTSSTLVIADATHGHTADAISLTTQSALSVADALHAHTADNVTLTDSGVAALTIADALHSHTVDGLTLSTESVLALQDALHAHAADGISLDSNSALQIADSLHAHTADGVALTMDAFLVVADATHGHLAEALVLTLPGTGADPAAVWAYVLPSGLSAADTVSQIHAMLTALTGGTIELPVDVKKMNGAPVVGTGQPADLWRGA